MRALITDACYGFILRFRNDVSLIASSLLAVGLNSVVTIPADSWPLELAVFNSTARQRVLGALLRLGTTDVASIAARTGISRSMVLRHLDALEALGVVVGSPPRSVRPGRAVNYVVDRARYAECLTTWDSWMMPPAGGAREKG